MANDYNLACWTGPGQALTWRHVSALRQTTTAGTDFWITRAGSAVTTIVLDGVEWQATCYWGPSGKLVLKVCSNRGSFKQFIYNGKRGLSDIGPPSPADDSHQTCHCNFDSLGHVHFVFNHHNSAFNYRVTTLPVDDPAFVGAVTTATTPAVLDSVTYPNLIKDPVDGLWLFTGQGASTALRDQYLFKLTTPGASPVWTAATGTGTNGIVADGQSNSEGVYFGDPDFSPDWDGAGTGRMGFAAMWKVDAGSTTLHDPFYLQYDGTTFSKRSGAQTIPVTPANCETLDASGTGNNFSSGASVTFDSLGRPHMTWLKGATDCAIIHAYHNGVSWVLATVVTGVGPDAFIMPGTLVCWEDDTISIVIRRESDGHMVAYSSLPNDYTDWTTFDELTNVDTGAEFTAAGFDGVAACPDKWGIRNKNRFEFPLPISVTKPFLLENLSNYWDLRDVEDSQGHAASKVLTNNNSVTFAAGSHGNAADFETGSSTSQNLSVASNQVIPATGSVTVACLFKLEDISVVHGIIGAWLSAGNLRGFAANFDSATSRIQAFVSKEGTTNTSVTANNFGAPASGTWYGMILVIDAANNQIRLRVGTVGGALAAANTAAHTADGTTGDHVFQTIEAFRIGRGTSNVAANYFDGMVDELCTLAEAWDTAREDAWWRSGDPLTFDEFGMIAPDIWSHGATATVAVNAGDTAVATLSAYGDIPMTWSLTGANAASFTLTDNGNGTATLAFAAPAVAGSYSVTANAANPASEGGTDAVAFTVTVPSSTPTRTANLGANRKRAMRRR